MPKKRDIYDRRFFSFRDQLTPRYGYEDAKKLAYEFIKFLRKEKADLNYNVMNLRCGKQDDYLDMLKYRDLRLKNRDQGDYNYDKEVIVNGNKYSIGFDIWLQY